MNEFTNPTTGTDKTSDSNKNGHDWHPPESQPRPIKTINQIERDYSEYKACGDNAAASSLDLRPDVGFTLSSCTTHAVPVSGD
jgi:hypothetical protein